MTKRQARYSKRVRDKFAAISVGYYHVDSDGHWLTLKEGFEYIGGRVVHERTADAMLNAYENVEPQPDRFFVVDGKVVTGSVYKVGNTVYQSPDVEEEATFFAQMRVNQFQPDDAFVLDIALTPDGYKVIEVNCINSAGLYAIDVSKMTQAVDALAMKDK